MNWQLNKVLRILNFAYTAVVNAFTKQPKNRILGQSKIILSILAT